MFVATKHVSVDTKVCLSRLKLCHDKIMVVRQKYFCRDKTFVTTICWDKYLFVATNTSFIVTKLFVEKQLLSRQIFIATKVLLRQTYFVATKDVSRQKLYLWQLPPMIEKGVSATVAAATTRHSLQNMRTLSLLPSLMLPNVLQARKRAGCE